MADLWSNSTASFRCRIERPRSPEWQAVWDALVWDETAPGAERRREEDEWLKRQVALAAEDY